MTTNNAEPIIPSIPGELGDVWEDTVIIAFRDLQWRRWLDDIAKATPEEAKAMRVLGPDACHKLDGNAESLFGDILTNYEGRHFVLEFKSARSEHMAERGKKMFEAVSNYLITANNTTDRALRDRFMVLSTSCHFGAFGTRILKGEAQRETLQQIVGGAAAPSIPNEPTMGKLAIEAHTYLDWIHVANRKWLNTTASERKKLPKLRRDYVNILTNAVTAEAPLRNAMKNITDRIESPTRRSLAALLWGEEKERAGANSKDYIEYLTMLTTVVGGNPATPITLLAVVDRTIFYWTTSVAHLKHSLAYWAALKQQAIAKTAADQAAQQGGTAPAIGQAKGAHTGTLKSSQ
jgi:hypothetical protein